MYFHKLQKHFIAFTFKLNFKKKLLKYLPYLKEYKKNIIYIYITKKSKLNTENLCHAIIRNFLLFPLKFKLSNSKKQILPLVERISFYFSYLYADLLVYHVSLILCLYSFCIFCYCRHCQAISVSSRRLRLSGYFQPSPLQIQRARAKVVL